MCFFSPSPSTHLLLPSSSYPWLHMVVNLFLTHLLLEVASSIIFLPSLFRCHWSSRSKGLHLWRRSKAYKLHMKLHHSWRKVIVARLRISSSSGKGGGLGLFLLFIILQGSSAPFIGLHFLKFSSILHCNRGLFLFWAIFQYKYYFVHIQILVPIRFIHSSI